MKYRNKWKTWLVYGLIVLPWCCYCSIMRCRMASTWRCSNRCLSFYVCLSVCLSVYVSGFDNKMRRQTGLSFDNQSLSMIGTYCRLDWLICWGQILSLIYHWNDDAFVMAIMTASISFSEFPASFYPPPRQTRLIAGGVLLSTQPVCPSVRPSICSSVATLLKTNEPFLMTQVVHEAGAQNLAGLCPARLAQTKINN